MDTFPVPPYPLPSLTCSPRGQLSCWSSISLALSLGALSLGLASHYGKTQLATTPVASGASGRPEPSSNVLGTEAGGPPGLGQLLGGEGNA